MTRTRPQTSSRPALNDGTLRRSAVEVACVVAERSNSNAPRRREATSNHPRAINTPPVLMLLAMLMCTASVRACPMCKDSTVASTQASSSLDFNRSIYIMLGGFTGFVGMTGTVLYKALKPGH